MLDLLYQKSASDLNWQMFKSHGCPETTLPNESQAPYSFIANLPPLLRNLLVTDGTVTRSLEAYFWEPVIIQQIALNSVGSAQDIPWLRARRGDELLLREVRLVGKRSANVYASAYSVVRMSTIPLAMRQQLKNGGIGIGVLIRECGLESYRELLDLGMSDTMYFATVPLATREELDDEYVFRTYCIHLDEKPAILITEKFPKGRYFAAA